MTKSGDDESRSAIAAWHNRGIEKQDVIGVSNETQSLLFRAPGLCRTGASRNRHAERLQQQRTAVSIGRSPDYAGSVSGRLRLLLAAGKRGLRRRFRRRAPVQRQRHAQSDLRLPREMTLCQPMAGITGSLISFLYPATRHDGGRVPLSAKLV